MISRKVIMSALNFDTKQASATPDAIAPDGSEVRLLCATARGGMALFSLAPGAVSKPVVHRTVEEIWYVISGSGRMWRSSGDQENITALAAGTSISIPVGTRFQFRCDGAEPIEVVAVTMPPWPGADEAISTAGIWPATI
jgi:mannose-6-phosphate isomerase-like protein (cupin superfamily)